MAKPKYTPSPCETCDREQRCNTSTYDAKRCPKWRAWFKIAWREVTDPLRKIFDVKKGKRK